MTSKSYKARREPPCIGPKGLPLTVHWMRSVNASFLPAFHADMEFQYIRRGFGWYFIAGEACHFFNNTLIVIKPNDVHHLVMGERPFLEKCCVMVSPSFFSVETRVLKPFAKLPRVMRLALAESAQIEWLLLRIGDESKADHDGQKEITRAYLKLFCLIVSRRARIKEMPSGNPQASRLIGDLMAFCEANYMRKVAGIELERQFGYSADYLSHLLRRYTGCTFKRFMMERRIAEAKNLLKSKPNLKVAAIGEAIGFNSFPLFNRMFKHIAGLTAREYRGN